MSNPESINSLNSDLFAAPADDRFRSPVEARKKAMDYLARREYGQRELIRKLCGAGYDAAVAEASVLQLSEDGLQDDRRFIENLVQSRINQGKGPVKIQADLAQRGLAGSLVSDVLEDTAVDWCDLACRAREKKFGSAQPGDFKEKTRQMRFLQQRGFEQAQIQAAVSGDRFD